MIARLACYTRRALPLCRRTLSTAHTTVEDINALKLIVSELKEAKNFEVPRMFLGFTCKMCSSRSHHTISKLAYTKGTVLVQCPCCKNRHLISDHLNWFDTGRKTIEEILESRGETVRRQIDGEPREFL